MTALLLVGAGAASAANIGANDDSAKHLDDRGAAMFGEMTSLGLRQVVIGVRFAPSAPTVVQDKALLDDVIPNALAAGLRVVLAVYPYPPRELEAGLGSPSQFGSYASTLASIYPQVKQFVIGNEPNQPAFWRPQFGSGGENASAAAFGGYLAAAYDALKAVDPAITVVGVGLSPRGNDKPAAKSNVSTSPVRFLRTLGTWYRRSGRTRPLMDAFSFHPYPGKATDPLERGYAWPNAGFVNLDRVKQALWDAFHHTAQPTTLDGLKIHLDEVGWQVDTSTHPGYQGSENVPVTDELAQGLIYEDLVRRAACDPDIGSLSFFGFRDDGLRTGFQAGLQRVDGTERVAAAAVKGAIAETGAGCAGKESTWRPLTEVVGARVAVRSAASTVTAQVGAGEDARGVVCVRGMTAARATRRCQAFSVVGMRKRSVSLTAPAGAHASIEVTVDLAAEANDTRRSRVVQRAVLKR